MQCASIWEQGRTKTGSAAGKIFEDVQHKRCKEGREERRGGGEASELLLSLIP
jgi:hypothetical protein